MATERLDIVIAQKGGKVVKRDIEAIGRSAVKTKTSVNLLKRAIGFLGLAAGVSEVVRLADSYTNLQNRLKTVTSSTEELAQANERLFDIANSTRTAIDGNVALFSRLSQVQDDLGATTDQLFTATRAVSQAFRLSGASAADAARGSVQLAQALGEGTFRAEEFNSINETAPLILSNLAKSIGVTRGELRRLVVDGKITSEVLFNSLLQSASQLNDQFSELAPTISGAFTVLRNNLTQFIGQANQASGAGNIIAQAILQLANNLELVAGVIVTAAIPAILRMTQAWLLFAATNPATLLLTLASAALVFGNQLKLSEETGATFQDFFLAVFGNLKEGFVALGQTIIDGLFEVDTTNGQTTTNFSGNWNDAILAIGQGMDNFRAGVRSTGRIAGEIFVALGETIERAIAAGLNAAIELLNKFIEKLNGALSIVNSISAQLGGATTDLRIPTIPNVGTPAGAGGPLGAFDGLQTRGQAIINEEFGGVANGQGAVGQLLQESLRAADTIAQKRRQLYDERIIQQRTAREQELQGIASVGNAFDEMATQGENAFNRIGSAGGTFNQNITNIGQQINNVFTNAFSSLEQALVGFVTTGKFDFKQLINSMLADLARLAVQMLIIRPLMGMFGGFFGGLFGFAQGGFVGGIPGFANGGIVGGFGGSTADNVLARLSPKEFVVNAESTKQNRGALEYINRTGSMPPVQSSTGGTVFAPTIIVENKGGDSSGSMEMAKMVEQSVKKAWIEMGVKQKRNGGILRQNKGM